MRFLALLLLVVASAQAQESADRWERPGFEIAPSGGAWHLEEAEDTHSAYRFDQDGFAVRLNVEQTSLGEFPDNRSFLAMAEERKDAELPRLENHGLHYYFTSTIGMTCFKYDATMRDSSIDDAQNMLNRVGFLCRHPTASKLGIELEFEHRAESEVLSDMDRLRLLTADFMQSAVTALDPDG